MYNAPKTFGTCRTGRSNDTHQPPQAGGQSPLSAVLYVLVVAASCTAPSAVLASVSNQERPAQDRHHTVYYSLFIAAAVTVCLSLAAY
jgi:hypothetical protein